MKLPDLDPTGGELAVSELLIEYDGPQLFTARNAGGSQFLALHGPNDGPNDTWIFSRTSAKRINQLKRFEITLREALVYRPMGLTAIVSYRGDEIIHTEYLQADSIPEAFLPHLDSYLGVPANSKNLIVSGTEPKDLLTITDNVEEDLPISTAVSLWEFDKRTIEYFRRRMTPINVVARRRGRLVADIVFSTPDEHTYFPVPELGKILINLQKTLDSLASDDGQKTSKGRPTAAIKRKAKLDAVATFPSSFGLRVEAHEGSLIESPESEVAFRRFVDLLSSIVDERAMREVFSLHTVETKLFFGEVIKEIAKAGSSIRIAAGSAHQDSIQYAAVPADIVTRLASQISEINNLNQQEVDVEGRLRAVSLKSKFFLIENDDESHSGRISDDILPQISGAEINAFYRARILQTTKIHEVTGEIEHKQTLLKLEKLSPAHHP